MNKKKLIKKKVRLVLGILLLNIVALLSYKIITKLNYKNEVTERTKVIPSFSFFDLKGKKFTNKNLKNKSIVFIYFNSDCDYCHSKASKIKEKLQKFNNVQLVFISFEEKKRILKFARQYKLDNRENIVFLEDRMGEFSKLFDVNSIPYIVIYDSNGKLLKKFKGITKINDILKVLE